MKAYDRISMQQEKKVGFRTLVSVYLDLKFGVWPDFGPKSEKNRFCLNAINWMFGIIFFLVKVNANNVYCTHEAKKLKFGPYSAIFDTKNQHSTRIRPKTSKLSYNGIRTALTCIVWSEFSKKVGLPKEWDSKKVVFNQK